MAEVWLISTCYKTCDHSLNTQIIIIFFSVQYKNEWKEHIFGRQKDQKR